MFLKAEEEDEEEDLVEVMFKLSATTADSHALREISRILHTLPENTIENSTMS